MSKLRLVSAEWKKRADRAMEINETQCILINALSEWMESNLTKEQSAELDEAMRKVAEANNIDID